MNEVIQNILNRRSVRIYTEEQIRQDDLDLILKAATYAPSACNTQPWHFTVIQNRELIETLDQETKNVLCKIEDNELFQKLGQNENYKVFYNAPTIIIVSGEKSSHCPLTDCSAATQNMHLAAESIDIGSCWIGLITYLLKSPKGEEFLKTLQIPEGYEPYFAITLGYKKYPNAKPAARRENTISYIK